MERDALEKATELLKKVGGINLTNLKNTEKAEVIDALRPTYRLKELLQLFNISKSSYFYSAHAAMHDKYAEIRPEITELFRQNELRYGYRRIHEVLENRNLNLQRLDDAGINDGHVSDKSDTIEDEVTDKEKNLAAISASLKTLEVLGQILQNYPAEIDGTFKIDIIDEIHKLGMRSVQAIISTMGYLEETLVSAVMDRAIKKHEKLPRDEVALKVRKIVTVLISGMVRGMISKVATSLNSVYLLPAAKSALSAEDNISAKLILQELKLNCLDAPDYNEVQRLSNELEKDKNQFAQCILSSIVSNYLKYNKCDHRLRSRFCQLFGFCEKKAFVNNQIALRE